jgi:hypothetical protein
MSSFPVHGKNNTDQHDEDQQQTEEGLTIGGMCDHCTDQEAFVLRLMISGNIRWK